jgi:HAD superfamily hydrolase (TIGR01509 family)
VTAPGWAWSANRAGECRSAATDSVPAIEGGRDQLIDLDRIDAVLFDLDGVITDTAAAHAAAWKRVFDAYLRERAERSGEEHHPFDVETDYRRYVDGQPRQDGVRRFLGSRGIELPVGEPEDDPGAATVWGIGNRKNVEFQRHLAEEGVEPFASTVELLRALRRQGVRTAVFSASRNCVPVLRAAGVEELFEAKVDGIDAAELGLPGKPDPATIVEVGRRLGVEPGRAAVVEDALAGVEAGRRGGFAVVIGVDRGGDGEGLREAGADIVVADLAELGIDRGSGDE